MRRFGWLVFATIVVALFGGCGGSTPDESSAPASDTAPTTEAEQAEAPTAAPDPTAVPAVATVAPSPTPEPVIDPVVFADDFGTSIAPIFADKCASCHNTNGPGASHWQLEKAGDLAATSEWVGSVVETGYMPPWPASDLSLAFHDDRGLRADQVQAIADWVSAGAPVDVDESTPIVASNGVARLVGDLEIAPSEPYQGSTATVDDYRCFIYEFGLEETAWMQGFEFVPDQTEIVHHAIGYLVPAIGMAEARNIDERDEGSGWQCYGGSGLAVGDDLFLGWAPGQLPTVFPEGSGIQVNPGDFVVMQIHYHYDNEAPADSSTINIDWADGQDLDRINFAQLLGPAEIPCSTAEEGPLCDRESALRLAWSRYGPSGVLADNINAICGVTPADFADQVSGIVSSSCDLPVRDFGEIVSVFGHEHEIGSAFRLTLNPGLPTEQILLDIPDWSFDWQYNYYPSESVMLSRGDTVRIECTWDRARRAPSLEPAYVLWADGTNDEMCFSTIATRELRGDAADDAGSSAEEATEPELSGVAALLADLPDELVDCMADAGVSVDQVPGRAEVDPFVSALFGCAEPDQIGEALTGSIAENFDGLVDDQGTECLATAFADPDAARQMLIFSQPDSTTDERVPIGEIVGECVRLSAALAAFGFPLPESASECIDEAGRPLISQATVAGDLPPEQTLLTAITPCLTGE